MDNYLIEWYTFKVMRLTWRTKVTKKRLQKKKQQLK